MTEDETHPRECECERCTEGVTIGICVVARLDRGMPTTGEVLGMTELRDDIAEAVRREVGDVMLGLCIRFVEGKRDRSVELAAAHAAVSALPTLKRAEAGDTTPTAGKEGGKHR